MALVLTYIRITVMYYVGRIRLLFPHEKTKLTISVDTIINSFSYRYSDQKRRLPYSIMFLKLVIKKIWKESQHHPVKTYYPDSETAVFYATDKYEQLIINCYMRPLGEDKLNFAASYDHVNFPGNLVTRIAISLIFFLNTPYLILLFILNRKNEEFAFYELLEIAIVTSILREKKIHTIYTFNSYEKFSNFFALAVQKYNIRINKICSPNPIEFHYSKVVADKFIFTAPFQFESYERLKHNWFVSHTQLWPIYTFEECKKMYFNGPEKEPPRDVIGFYSSGYPIRIEKGINIVGQEMYDSEVELIELLNRFLEKNTQYALKIYLHPIEKSSDTDIKKSKYYYSKFFSRVSERILFPPENVKTIEDFLGVDVALSVCSSINYERLYSGYKSLYSQTMHRVSLFSGTKLDNITIKSRGDFDRMLTEALTNSRKEFFLLHNIKEYIFYGTENGAE